MFTGFATENTPAIKFWNFFSSAVSTGSSRISLTDDCAPIQYFRTGGTTNAILLYLPTSPIEGKSIRIINAYAGTNAQTIAIAASDTTYNGSYTTLHTLAQGDSIELIYSKDWLSFAGYGANAIGYYSGWLALDRMPFNAVNGYGRALSGNNNRASNYLAVVGGGNGNTASGQYSTVAGGNSNSASNFYGVIGGGNGNFNSAQSSVVAGGSGNNASANQSAIGGGSGNTTTAVYGTIAGGQSSSVQSDNGAIGGGFANYVQASYGHVGGGVGNYATGGYAGVLGGNNNIASGLYSAVLAGSYGTTRSLIGYSILTGGGAPLATSHGRSQAGVMVLGVQTTDATATIMKSDANAASTGNQYQVNTNSVTYFVGELVASVTTSAGNAKGWSFAGVAKKGASAATIAFVGTPTITSSFADAGASTWTAAITVDTSNGTLRFTVTGQAATTINWVCQIRTTEVSFP